VATNLYHRIRDVMRRLSLRAPDLDDEKHGVDPNTVAEYLDNVLPDERVQDFEKVCLESDMHLAEVASCHQVLAVALGEAAEIEQASREHMYMLPQVAADLENMDRPTDDPLGVEFADDSMDQGTKVPGRPSPIVPDYLRDKPRRFPVVPVVMGSVVAVCVVVILLVLTGVIGSGDSPEQIGQNDPVNQNPNQNPGQNPNANQNTNQNPPAGQDNQVTPPTGTTPTDPSSEFPTVHGLENPNDTTPGTEPNETPNENPTGDTPSGETPAGDTPAVPDNLNTPQTPTGTGDIANPVTPGPSDLGPTPVPANPTEGTPAEETPPAGHDPNAKPPVEPEPASASIGRFVSENQALVRYDLKDKSWKIVPQQNVLNEETLLVALPTFRPIIATPSGLSVQLLSESQIAMKPVRADEMPSLELQNGRIILRSLGKQNVRLSLTAGGKTGIVTLVNPESAAAIGLAYHRDSGLDPANVPSEVEVKFYTISGQVLWEEEGKPKPLQVDAAEYISFTAKEEKPELEVLAKVPDWVKPEPISRLDQNGAEKILEAFGKNQIASLALRELLDYRQREVSRLALKCLTQLGEFDPAVASFDDAAQRLTWDKTMGQLIEIVAQSPEKAQKVKEAFEREYGDSASSLWRMLWGYTPDQLKNDAAAQLVEYLDKDRLAFRVLSFYNLRKITGKTNAYQPEDTPFQRKVPTNRWRTQLRKGEVVLKGSK
jgi:hypothetical protein